MPLERKHIPPQGEVFGLGGGTPQPESEVQPNLSGWTLMPSVQAPAETPKQSGSESQAAEPPVAGSPEPA
jgi:hypothetical protein